MPKHYDYIISGTGCAGLSLAMHMLRSGKFSDKKILLVDEADKNKNDRTWCFWEKEEGIFQDIVFRQWDYLWFYGEEFYKEFSISPYRYKMIRGIDFYTHCIEQLTRHSNFEFKKGKIEQVFSSTETGVLVDGEKILSQYVFNSILFEKPCLTQKHHWLLQHFKGWQIKLTEKTFDSSVATFMDFRISQKHGTAFCYVLPFSDKEALVEYTLFTPTLLKDEQYDEGLADYLHNTLRLSDYTISHTEFGVIPMTNYKFKRRENNIINLGTAGGQTKGSSGYTFYFIQQHSKAIVERLVKTGNPFVAKPPARYHFYDSIFLNVLQQNFLPGKKIFSELFKKNKATDVLTFLNNESGIQQDLKVISSLPTLPFLKAAIKQYT